jgi:hypothetical protein
MMMMSLALVNFLFALTCSYYMNNYYTDSLTGVVAGSEFTERSSYLHGGLIVPSSFYILHVVLCLTLGHSCIHDIMNIMIRE